SPPRAVAPPPPARTPPAPVPVAAPARPPTTPIMGARPPAASLQASGSGSAPTTLSQVPKLLKETEVYVTYGLHDKATEHLRRIFSVDPDNIDAHERAKTVALAMGNTEEDRKSTR